MFVQSHQIVERIYPVELTGVDQAHENVPDLRPMERLIGKRVFPVLDRHFQGALTDIMPPLVLCRVAAEKPPSFLENCRIR